MTPSPTSLSIPGPLPRGERILAWTVWIFHSLFAFLIAYWVSNGKARPWVKHWMQKSSIQCIAVLYSFAFIVIASTWICRWKCVPWLLCIIFIAKATQFVPFSSGTHIFYREFNIYLYGSIKILNYCLHLCNNTDSLKLKHALLYFAYLPYSMTLIVTFEDFLLQFQRWDESQKFQKSIDWHNAKRVFLFGARLLFWFFFFELLLHFIHVNALFNSPSSIVNSLNVYEVCAVAYVTGQLFHLKYVVIFGVPAFFAYLDGLTPPPPPICISRVSLYSRMWRYFDNGLYQFLKHQVYIPVMKKRLPLFLSILRNIGALFAVFGVVLAWHGTRRHYICWVALSATELLVERIGYQLWKLQKKNNRHTNATDSNSWNLRSFLFFGPGRRWRDNSTECCGRRSKRCHDGKF
uniref:Protein-cysteine N-palmitoyltransferase Rasp n=1 Tax=Caenorhabditis japonica TaxID=281687 RepID=A0A8R1DMK1_CAEJA